MNVEIVERVTKMTSEKYCLNWNEFQKNISSSFHEMRDDLNFADVTLASEDRKQFQAHKLVLSTSSTFFKEILQNNKHSHPLIYMKGMKAEALESVLDFLYNGEVNIYQEDLNDFMTLAEELELKGLTGQQSMENENSQTTFINKEMSKLNVKPKIVKKVMSKKESPFSDEDLNHVKNICESPKNLQYISTDIVAMEKTISTNNYELNETVDSLLEKIGDTWNCRMCGKQSGHKMNLKRHIESKHTTGGSHACRECGKIFRSSSVLNNHVSMNHRKNN